MRDQDRVADENLALQARYDITALVYDVLDAPWERLYRAWRPRLLADVSGRVLEAGVGTGRNLAHYHPDVDLVGLDLSPAMLRKAARRAQGAPCRIELVHDDATVMGSLDSRQFDWVFSTFMCCVMPDELQPRALEQFVRVLKPGGRFRLLEMVWSEKPSIRARQRFFAPFVERVYGARFDRDTLGHVRRSPDLELTGTSFLKDDVYLLIDGVRST